MQQLIDYQFKTSELKNLVRLVKQTVQALKSYWNRLGMCIFCRICEIIFLVGGPWKSNVILEKSLRNGCNFCMNPGVNLLSLNLLWNHLIKYGWDKYVLDSSLMSMTEVLNRCNDFPFKCLLASLIVRVRLSRCCIELHYGTIFEDANVSSRAEKRLRMCVDMRQRTQAQARAHSKWLPFCGK